MHGLITCVRACPNHVPDPNNHVCMHVCLHVCACMCAGACALRHMWAWACAGVHMRANVHACKNMPWKAGWIRARTSVHENMPGGWCRLWIETSMQVPADRARTRRHAGTVVHAHNARPPTQPPASPRPTRPPAHNTYASHTTHCGTCRTCT